MNKIKKVFNYFDFRKINLEIKGYGYSYSLKSYLFHITLTFICIIIAGWFFKLKLPFIIILSIVSLTCFPLILTYQFKYLHSNKKFEDLVGYMDSMIFSFKKKNKILDALKNTAESTDGELKTSIDRAIDIIENDSTGEHIYEKAFNEIESDYRCTRIISLHKFLIGVERVGGNYQASINTLLDDIHAWVNRTYEYQANLKSIKSKILLSIGLTILICGSMIQILPTDIADIKSTTIYQIATTFLLSSLMIIFTIVQTKLNGQWLVNDLSDVQDTSILKDIQYINTFDRKRELKKSIINALIFSIVTVVCIITKNTFLICISILFIIGFFIQPNLKLKSSTKRVERAINKEFPLWLRDIALQLQNYVVPLAIRNSISTAAPVLKSHLLKLDKEITEDPTSIEPYKNFLKEYRLADLTTAMKMLYTLQQLGADEAEKQISDLVMRNQKLLAKSEEIANEDTLAGIGFITALPMILGGFKLASDLVLVVLQFLTLSGGYLQ